MKKNTPLIIPKNGRFRGRLNMNNQDRPKNIFQQRVLEIVQAIPRGHVLTYGQLAALVDTPRAARQVGRILYFYGQRVPWQRVINHYGGISTYKVGSGELQRVLLEEENVVFTQDGTIDLNRYQWRPALQVIKKLRLPEEIAFQINARLPFSRGRFKRTF
jgi:methylated-DNA-protein-cysteine methyltransferase-like protein